MELTLSGHVTDPPLSAGTLHDCGSRVVELLVLYPATANGTPVPRLDALAPVLKTNVTFVPTGSLVEYEKRPHLSRYPLGHAGAVNGRTNVAALTPEAPPHAPVLPP